MEKQPRLDVVSGDEALEQLARFPLPVDTGLLHIPEQQLTWPILVPQSGLSVRLNPESPEQLTYGIVTAIIAFEETFHLLGRVDYAYGELEDTALFRLDYQQDKQMLDAVAELGIVALAAEKPPQFAEKAELGEFLTRVTTFVCQLDAQEVHRLRIQLIRMDAQQQHQS